MLERCENTYQRYCTALGVYFGPNRMYACLLYPTIFAPVLIPGEYNSMAAMALSQGGDEEDADDGSDDIMLDDDGAVYRNDLAVQSGSDDKLTSFQ